MFQPDLGAFTELAAHGLQSLLCQLILCQYHTHARSGMQTVDDSACKNEVQLVGQLMVFVFGSICVVWGKLRLLIW